MLMFVSKTAVGTEVIFVCVAGRGGDVCQVVAVVA